MNCKCNEKVEIKYVNKGTNKLVNAYKGDSCVDIYANEDIKVSAFETKAIPTGLYFDIPEGYELLVRPKSGKSNKGLEVSLGTVDSCYTGEVLVNMRNMRYDDIIRTIQGVTQCEINQGDGYKNYFTLFKKGDKIAQLFLGKVIDVEYTEVNEIDKETDRAEKGFGSSGDR